MLVYLALHAWKASIADLHGSSVEDFAELIVVWEMFIQQLKKLFPYVRGYRFVVRGIKPYHLSFPITWLLRMRNSRDVLLRELVLESTSLQRILVLLC